MQQVEWVFFLHNKKVPIPSCQYFYNKSSKFFPTFASNKEIFIYTQTILIKL